MFGVADDLDLSGLKGRTLQQLSIGEARLELAFDDDWTLSIECAWRLDGSAGELGNGGRGRLVDEIAALRPLVGLAIDTASPAPPDRIELAFEKGYRLVIIDDNEMFEAFSIEPIGVIV
jgi:hypothetical protein